MRSSAEAGGLCALLSKTLIAYTRDWEAATDTANDVSLLQWSNLLRVIGEDGVLVTEAHKQARVSRRAMRSMLQLHGWVSIETHPGRGRDIARLTDAGLSALTIGRQRSERVERQWAERFGATCDELRRDLVALVSQVCVELPHFPIPYGPADGSVTGGDARPATDTPHRIPAHGHDWPIVQREPDSTTALPLSSLMSQALVAFSIDYDAAAGVGRTGMELTAMLARVTAGGVPLEVMPRTRAWPDWLERHSVAIVEPDPTRPRKQRIRRTDKGDRLHTANMEGLAEVEQEWRDRFGDDVVDSLHRSLGALVEVINDPMLPEFMLVVFVGGYGFIVVE